jgi:hypothetical protein
LVKADGRIGVAGQMVLGKKQATLSHLVYLSGNMDNDSNCKAGIIQFLAGKTTGGQIAQAI